ncbi:PaaI family thioesterase [Pseudonocardia pini]|uniref:PaaI family thioesterase n=1 Tax=Pseudonocardia pini TaxID=2758030 RepID=UPI001C692783|nr:PaaI family thioesterase [Pseudonocardia pini]
MSPTDSSADRGTPAGLDDQRWGPHRGRAPVPPEGFVEMVDELRVLLDRVTAAAPPADLVAEMTKTFTELSARLEPYEVGEREQLTGHLSAYPGRAQTMSPQLFVTERDTVHAAGHVTYGRYFLGGNGAVHGGAIPLLFDEIMGRLSNTGGRKPARTAYLHVDFRSITPIEKQLRIEARIVSEEGRKRLIRGTLEDGDTLCAEAEGLFVALNPGQP